MTLRRRLLGDLPLGLALILGAVLLSLASATRSYAAVWRSESALWAYAVRLAPEKPRVLNNYGVTLAMVGRLEDARTVFVRAHLAGHATHLPPWDRVEGELRSRQNLVAVNELIAEVRR